MTTQKICLVLGAGPGVGMATGRRFAQAGYSIVLAARRIGAIQPLADNLTAEGFKASAVQVDCSDESNIRAVVAACGSVAVLLYNAAGVTMQVPSAITATKFNKDLFVSVTGALVASQAVTESMSTDTPETLLFTGGGFAMRPMAALMSLGVGKAGLRNLVFSLGEEFRSKGIRVGTVTIMGTVSPGSAFDPAAIAEAFFQLHMDRDYKLGLEISFTGQNKS